DTEKRKINNHSLYNKKSKTEQLVELSDSVQSISRASTYSESNETLQEFVTSHRL
ncbi:6093_t:CDS:2, partial [Cetraspora pellucida]